MIRHLVLGAVAGGIVLLSPYQASAAQSTPLLGTRADQATSTAMTSAPAAAALNGGPSPVYAVDNPAQPGDAFPNSPYSGGTD